MEINGDELATAYSGSCEEREQAIILSSRYLQINRNFIRRVEEFTNPQGVKVTLFIPTKSPDAFKEIEERAQTRENLTRVAPKDHSPLPRKIKIRNGTSVGNFGKAEVEASAGFLISFFQQKNTWCSFTIEDLHYFYENHYEHKTELGFGKFLYGIFTAWHDDGHFSGETRTPDTYIIQYNDASFRVTNAFIEKCTKTPK